MVEYKNRYGDVYTFTKLENGNVLWKGSFDHVRVGFPNVYKEAYDHFLKDGGELNQYDFEEKVHEQLYDEEGHWIKAGPITEKYSKLVHSDHDNITMVDPSGGPYINKGTNLNKFGDEFKGLLAKYFIWNKDKKAYEIQTYGEFDHLEDIKTVGGLTL